MRMDVIRRSFRKQWLVFWLVTGAGGLFLPAVFAGHGFYVHNSGGPRWSRPGGYGAHPGFQYGGPRMGWGSPMFGRPPLGRRVVYYSQPYSPFYGSYSYPGGYGFSSFNYPGCGLVRPFPFDQPRIYVYPQPPAVNCVPAESSYRRIFVLNLNPEETSEAGALDHTLPPVPEEAVFRPVQPRSVDPQQAWTYLENEAYQDALSAFGALAASNSEQGGHKVGFGLAAALAGDKITAAYALRRAFETDPQGAASAPLSPVLRDKMRNLAASYSETLRKDPDNLNVRFLFASVSHLAQDHATARTCLAQAVSGGDKSASTANLQKIVENSLASR
jgi:hypothetical protein